MGDDGQAKYNGWQWIVTGMREDQSSNHNILALTLVLTYALEK